MNIEQRVQQLEQQNRRFRLGLTVVVVALCGVVTMAATRQIGYVSNDFTLVDDRGDQRGYFSIVNDRPVLVMYGDDGRPAIVLDSATPSGPQLTVGGQSGPRVSMGTADETAFLAVSKSSDRSEQISLHAGSAKGATVRVNTNAEGGFVVDAVSTGAIGKFVATGTGVKGITLDLRTEEDGEIGSILSASPAHQGLLVKNGSTSMSHNILDLGSPHAYIGFSRDGNGIRLTNFDLPDDWDKGVVSGPHLEIYENRSDVTAVFPNTDEDNGLPTSAKPSTWGEIKRSIQDR